MSLDNTLQYIDELETLRVSAELFLNNLSQAEVLSIMSERAIQISQATYCETFIRHPNDRDFISALHYPKQGDNGYLQDVSATSQKLAFETIQKQYAITINHTDTEPLPIKSWVAFPFKVMGNIVGALCLGHKNYQAFSPYTIKLLSIFVDQASIAISNAQLFEDLTQAYSKLADSRAEILESRNTLQTLFDGISDGLYIVDQNLNIVMVNQTELRHLQLSEQDVLAKTFISLGWKEDAPIFVNLIQQTFKNGQKGHWIPPETNNAPLVKNREFHLYPIVLPEGEVQQVIVLAQDMTEHKQLQATLFQSSNLAAIGQLATSVAHEINNPLTIALTNTQLLMMELDTDHPSYELVDDIYASNTRIKNIVSNLVDLSNQEEYIFTRLNLITTLEDAVGLVAHPLRKSGVKIERLYNSQPTIIASLSHLKLAWMNLLLNACEAIVLTNMPGIISIEVEETPSGYVQIKITDTGVGIPSEYNDLVFRPFFTTKQEKKSVGLGLFTAHAIIERHQGTITFNSGPQGTSFIIQLPLNITFPR